MASNIPAVLSLWENALSSFHKFKGYLLAGQETGEHSGKCHETGGLLHHHGEIETEIEEGIDIEIGLETDAHLCAYDLGSFSCHFDTVMVSLHLTSCRRNLILTCLSSAQGLFCTRGSYQYQRSWSVKA